MRVTPFCSSRETGGGDAKQTLLRSGSTHSGFCSFAKKYRCAPGRASFPMVRSICSGVGLVQLFIKTIHNIQEWLSHLVQEFLKLLKILNELCLQLVMCGLLRSSVIVHSSLK